MKNLSVSVLIATLLVASIFVSKADTKQDIDKANEKGQVVFLIVTEKGNPKNQEALGLAQKAQKLYSKSAIIELDRNSSSNKELVQEYRLSGAPIPLILVVAKNGSVVGGAPLQGLTAEALVQMVPTPKLEDVYASIADSKPAIIVFTKKLLIDRTNVLKEAKEAVSILKNNATLIEVDIDDASETNFLNIFNISKLTLSSTVIVINKQGQVSGTATTVPDAKKLAAAATTVPKGGCGPGCGPSGCGK